MVDLACMEVFSFTQDNLAVEGNGISFPFSFSFFYSLSFHAPKKHLKGVFAMQVVGEKSPGVLRIIDLSKSSESPSGTNIQL